MNVAEVIEKLKSLPEDKQAEVIDYVEFLAESFGPRRSLDDWTEQQVGDLSMAEAMRGLEDEPGLYGEDDLKEQWS